MANIYDVARAAGVSTTTVSHVLNGTRHVNEDTKNRVLQAIDMLGFQPSSVARAMVRQETQTIALIVPASVQLFFAELACSVESYAFAAGYNVILCQTEHNPAKERAYFDMLISKRVDGVIHMTTDPYTPHPHSLRAHQIPVVTFDRDQDGIDSIVIDNFGGGYAATRHLLDLGHRRIGCVRSANPESDSARRVDGCLQAQHEAGITPDPALFVPGDWSFECGWTAAGQFLRLAAPPTAIFACNDMMAIGAIAHLSDQGVRVPEQVSVVGFDDIALARYSTPLLTTFATPITEVGQRLCQLLFDRINEYLPPEQQRILVRGDLKVRKSTARPPGLRGSTLQESLASDAAMPVSASASTFGRSR